MRTARTKLVKIVLLVLEFLVIICVAVTSIMMRQFLTPFQRGFFKDDQSLMYPFKPSSVTNVMLYTVGFLGSGTVIMVGELMTVRGKQKNRNLQFRSLPWSKWIGLCHRMLTLFALGAAMTHLLTNVLKYSVGRLRPHFYSVCQPDWSLLNDTSGYILQDICMSHDRNLITEARVSFPSGHSSISMYCATFLVLYLYKRYTWKTFILIRPLIQLTAFCMALYTCLTRISDYKHHWSDVLTGGCLGVLVAFLSIFKIFNVFEADPSEINSGNISTFVDFNVEVKSDAGDTILPDSYRVRST